MDRLGMMEVFVLAVETGSFSAVARRLGLGSHCLQADRPSWRSTSGSRLLLRSTRGLMPTEAGRPITRSPGRSCSRSTRLRPWCSSAGPG